VPHYLEFAVPDNLELTVLINPSLVNLGLTGPVNLKSIHSFSGGEPTALRAGNLKSHPPET